MDTIFALSSGAVPAGVAVFRVSGPKAFELMGSVIDSDPKPRQAALRYLKDPQSGELIDQALVLSFPGPNSFTGEDCIEFHCHGGRAVVQKMLSVMGAHETCRMAEAGEFSRRAFENGKMDLTEVEGLADLIHAETDMQRQQALRQASGKHRDKINEWRELLLYARSMIEAELDFADEEDIPGSVSDVIWPKLEALSEEVKGYLANARQGEIVRSGLTVVLVGHPNAGKSSLLNWFAKRDVAIVTEEAGTTRDVLDVHLDIEGFPVTLTDTAGLREAENIVEREGIRRALEKSKQADLLLELVDVSSDLPRVELESSAPRLVLLNKQDRVDSETSFTAPVEGEIINTYPVAVKTGEGMDRFYEAFVKQVQALFSGSEDVLITRERHAAHLLACVEFVDDALRYVESPIEIRSEFLRSAGDELGKITGKIDIEEMLGVIFSQFCVGK